MKTKYVKVPVSERLPEKEGIYPVIFNLGGEEIIESVLYNDKFGFHAENTDCRYVDEWLEEVPDHSEEMLSLLEGIVDAQYNPETTLSEMNIRVKKAKEFLNKVKDNGK
ncbi:hypothetical protein BBD31_01635 [Elizabethkingia anophelis]|uniref:hypothetical protein n=1 Tax=Elizabethkingia anophelis TaxID=1117645 RepID=UPI000995063E|nr:hypothetical protein [Elizabethkingia anophelis]AQW96676.1 hypothetical protein BBD31_01635 [Elizabethkingia anophelis]MDV3673671.1 hypothetical protein [Elizabethkingia anophelis]MDV3692395.1 hypothetical protein [Elizabethkingia anophelis]OPB50074.1 hypothetical protein BAY04_06865 [Elizabethkingia anophelis]SPW16811.1 Uncharacterised protein [Elizabethkingia anophelis]